MAEPQTLRDLMKRAQELQQHLVHAQADLAGTEVTGTAGDGLVTVTMVGTGEVSSVQFDPAALNQCDAHELAELTLAALHQATDAIKALTTQRMSAAASGFDVGPRYRGSGPLR